VLDTESTVRTFWIPVLPFGKDRDDTGSFIVKSFQRHYTSIAAARGREPRLAVGMMMADSGFSPMLVPKVEVTRLGQLPLTAFMHQRLVGFH